MIIGREQRFHPGYSYLERLFIGLMGVPVVGLRIRARNLLHLLNDTFNPSEILDAGSGPGVITFLLAAKYPKARVTGIDISHDEIDNCRQIASIAHINNTHFQEADISDIPWKNHFDLVVCIDILEHIENDKAAIASLADAISPGGTLVLHVPAKYRRYPVFKKTLNFKVPSHIREGYTLKDIKTLVDTVGLQIKDSGHTFGFLETMANNIGYMITKAEKRNRYLYALAFPLLNLMGWLGRGAKPKELGAGVYLILKKDPDISIISSSG